MDRSPQCALFCKTGWDDPNLPLYKRFNSIGDAQLQLYTIIIQYFSEGMSKIVICHLLSTFKLLFKIHPFSAVPKLKSAACLDFLGAMKLERNPKVIK